MGLADAGVVWLRVVTKRVAQLSMDEAKGQMEKREEVDAASKKWGLVKREAIKDESRENMGRQARYIRRATPAAPANTLPASGIHSHCRHLAVSTNWYFNLHLQMRKHTNL